MRCSGHLGSWRTRFQAIIRFCTFGPPFKDTARVPVNPNRSAPCNGMQKKNAADRKLRGQMIHPTGPSTLKRITQRLMADFKSKPATQFATCWAATTCTIDRKLRPSSRQWNVSLFRWVTSFSEDSPNFVEQSENNLHSKKKNAESSQTISRHVLDGYRSTPKKSRLKCKTTSCQSSRRKTNETRPPESRETWCCSM